MLDSQSFDIGPFAERLADRLAEWQATNLVRRMWERDHTVWRPEPEPELSDRLGWLELPTVMESEAVRLAEFAASVVADGITRVYLCGMGGSSLAPEVYARTFGASDGFCELTVVDSTHPDEVAGALAGYDPAASLVLVASKSGGTLETMSLFRAFWDRARKLDNRGDHFVAITDPGSALEQLAADRGFRDVFSTPPEVGGRYSALTFFGLVPAALLGVDIARLLSRAALMAEACSPSTPVEANPGASLGAIMGLAAESGMDKVTYLVSPGLAAFPVWVEQLVAESTGKDGLGIVPIADEPPGDASEYGDDRLIIDLVLADDEDPHRDLVEALKAAGAPVVSIRAGDPYDIAQEMFRAEFATAVAGSVLSINPFNQPNVQEAKELAKQAMAGTLAAGEIASVKPDDGSAIDQWLAQFRTGDYLGIQAYVPYGLDDSLARIRIAARGLTHGATTSGYGPRFLHSTGQLHKGGADNGMFLQIVDEPSATVPVPETDFDFGRLVQAQADGDYQALVESGRRVLRVDLGANRDEGIRALVEVFEGL